MNELEYNVMMKEAHEAALAELNMALIGMIEEIDGKVPSPDELNLYGSSVSVMDDTRSEMRRFVIWRAVHVLEWSRQYAIKAETTAIDGRVQIFIEARRVPESEWPPGLQLVVADLQRLATEAGAAKPQTIGMAIYKPTGRPVQLIEHINTGDGWVVRDENGKQFGARPEELEGMPPLGGAS